MRCSPHIAASFYGLTWASKGQHKDLFKIKRWAKCKSALVGKYMAIVFMGEIAFVLIFVHLINGDCVIIRFSL